MCANLVLQCHSASQNGMSFHSTANNLTRPNQLMHHQNQVDSKYYGEYDVSNNVEYYKLEAAEPLVLTYYNLPSNRKPENKQDALEQHQNKTPVKIDSDKPKSEKAAGVQAERATILPSFFQEFSSEQKIKAGSASCWSRLCGPRRGVKIKSGTPTPSQ